MLFIIFYIISQGEYLFEGFKQNSIMTKVGDGCCRYDGWKDNVKDKGYRSIPECLDLCSSDSNCWAADYKEPKHGKYKCMIYSSIKEPDNLHIECDKKTKCYKKEVIPLLKSEDEKCPTGPKKQTDLIHVVEDEVFVDKNEQQITIMDQIEKGLKELVGLQKRSDSCADDPNACRPGTLNEDQFVEFLKTENKLIKRTCNESEIDDSCKKSDKVQNLLKKHCQDIVKQKPKASPPKPLKVKTPPPSVKTIENLKPEGKWKNIKPPLKKPKDGAKMFREITYNSLFE